MLFGFSSKDSPISYIKASSSTTWITFCHCNEHSDTMQAQLDVPDFVSIPQSIL